MCPDSDGLRQLVAIFIYLLDNSCFVLELVNCVLKLTVKNPSICNNYDTVKDSFIPDIMQTWKAVWKPGNGIAFTGEAGGTINGSLLNYSQTPISLSGETSLTLTPSGSESNPSGFVPMQVLEFQPTSYAETAM